MFGKKVLSLSCFLMFATITVVSPLWEYIEGKEKAVESLSISSWESFAREEKVVLGSLTFRQAFSKEAGFFQNNSKPSAYSVFFTKEQLQVIFLILVFFILIHFHFEKTFQNKYLEFLFFRTSVL